VGNLSISAGDQQIGVAATSAMGIKEYLRRTAMSDFVISTVCSTVALQVRFDRCIGPEGAMVSNGRPFLWAIHPFTPGRTAPRASRAPVVAVVAAEVMRVGSRYLRASPRWAQALANVA
jgi:hypothetical protein